ncbi:MAG: hypothetical protein ABI254_11515 [Chthoniobacterales bacterium]
MSMPLVLGGPSGVGKSYFCKYLQENGWLHLEADQEEGNGIDKLGLRGKWDQFFEERKPEALAAELMRRQAEGKYSSVVLSLPSPATPDSFLIEKSIQQLKIRFLWGREEFCILDFLMREKRTGRNLDAAHWHNNNDSVMQKLSKPSYIAYLLNVYNADGQRKPLEDVLAMLA